MLDEEIGSLVSEEEAKNWLYENLPETGYGGPLTINNICKLAADEKNKNFNSSLIAAAIDGLIKDGKARTYFFSLSHTWGLERVRLEVE